MSVYVYNGVTTRQPGNQASWREGGEISWNMWENGVTTREPGSLAGRRRDRLVNNKVDKSFERQAGRW